MRRVAVILALACGLASVAWAGPTANWYFDVYTSDLYNMFQGTIFGTVHVLQYALDATGVDGYYSHEVVKLSQAAIWTGQGEALGATDYSCPGICGEQKYGKVSVYNRVIAPRGGSGLFNVNMTANFAGLAHGGGSYPDGNFLPAAYGVELEASGRGYQVGTGMYETTKGRSTNHFDYFLGGNGWGEIRYGASRFGCGANWGDGCGSVSLRGVEYNWAQATGSGTFIEDLGGDDFLQNYKFTLPGGGSISTMVNFNGGMDKTPIWMSGK